MTQRIDQGHLCVTPDGPKGPRQHVHQGLDLPGQPHGSADRRRGDGVQGPVAGQELGPFRRPPPVPAAACVVPEAVHVPPDADRETLEACRLEVERRMQAAMIEAEEWVEQF